MAVSKVVILLSIFLALIFTHVGAHASVGEEDDSVPVEVVGSDGGPDSSALKIELDQLKSKIHTLG